MGTLSDESGIVLPKAGFSGPFGGEQPPWIDSILVLESGDHSDVVGEPIGSWEIRRSRTVEYMREYTRLVVSRYRLSPAIWAWEFGNEYNLPADLPNAAEHRPPIVPTLGTPTRRGASDDLTHAQFRSALVEFTREVRRWDSGGLCSAEMPFRGLPRWHQMQEHGWGSRYVGAVGFHVGGG